MWGLLMPAVWALVASPRTSLPPTPRRPLLLVALLVTPAALFMATLLAGSCSYIIQQHGYQYSAISYEFLSADAVSVRHLWHHSSVLGVRVGAEGRGGPTQPLRLATQLLPAALALLSTRRLSSFWAVLFYLSMLLLGLAQLASLVCAVLLGVTDIHSRLLRPRWLTVTVAVCGAGLLLALPLACEGGLTAAQLLDYAVAGSWWQGLLQAAALLGMFLVRGRPYAGETVAAALLGPSAALGPLLSFTWNVVLPVAMIVSYLL